jgi:hypothetical protein
MPMSSPLTDGRRCWLRLRGILQPDGREHRGGDERTAGKQKTAPFQSTSAAWFRALFRLFRILIVTHDLILFLVMHLKPTWLAEVSIGSACRAAGR